MYSPGLEGYTVAEKKQRAFATILDFTADRFTATPWEPRHHKAEFARQFIRFVESDFDRSEFTEPFYHRLSQIFGHLAHRDRWTFYDIHFTTTKDKVRFLHQTAGHTCADDPAYTYSDVEQAIQAWMSQNGILQKYERAAQEQTQKLSSRSPEQHLPGPRELTQEHPQSRSAANKQETQLLAWAENYRRLGRLLNAGGPVQVQGHVPLTVVKLHEECWRVQLGDPAAPDHAYTFGIWPASPEASPKARPHYYEGKRPEELIDIWGDSPVDMPQADPAVEDQLGNKVAVFWAELEERGYFHLADMLARQLEGFKDCYYYLRGVDGVDETFDVYHSDGPTLLGSFPFWDCATQAQSAARRVVEQLNRGEHTAAQAQSLVQQAIANYTREVRSSIAGPTQRLEVTRIYPEPIHTELSQRKVEGAAAGHNEKDVQGPEKEAMKSFVVQVEEVWRFTEQVEVEAACREDAEWEAQAEFKEAAISWDDGTVVNRNAFALTENGQPLQLQTEVQEQEKEESVQGHGPVLRHEEREALRAVVDYLWDEEKEDHAANPAPDHIFQRLTLLRDLCDPQQGREAKTQVGPAAASGDLSQQEGVSHQSEATTERTSEPKTDRANEPYQVIDTRGIYQLIAPEHEATAAREQEPKEVKREGLADREQLSTPERNEKPGQLRTETSFPDSSRQRSTAETIIDLSEPEFMEAYPTIPNHLNPDAWPCRFACEGTELEFVKEQDPRRVWTLVEYDAKYILSGFHVKNRIGYYVTKDPVPEGLAVRVSEISYIFGHRPDPRDREQPTPGKELGRQLALDAPTLPTGNPAQMVEKDHVTETTPVTPTTTESLSYSDNTNDRTEEKPETPGLKPPSGNERNEEMAEIQNDKNGQSTKRQEGGKNKPLHKETHGAVQVTIWDNGPDREPTVNFGRLYRSSGGWKVAQSFQAKHLSDLMKATEAAALALGQELQRPPQSLHVEKSQEVCSIDSGRFAAVFSGRSSETTGTHVYAAKILCDGKQVFAPMLDTELAGLQVIAQRGGLPWLTEHVAREHLPEPTTNDFQHFEKTLQASQALMGRFMESGHKKVLADKNAVQELGLDVSGVPEQGHETTHDMSR
jgi:hypothetical protein